MPGDDDNLTNEAFIEKLLGEATIRDTGGWRVIMTRMLARSAALSAARPAPDTGQAAASPANRPDRDTGGWRMAPGCPPAPLLPPEPEGWKDILPIETMSECPPVITSFPPDGWDPLLKASALAAALFADPKMVALMTRPSQDGGLGQSPLMTAAKDRSNNFDSPYVLCLDLFGLITKSPDTKHIDRIRAQAADITPYFMKAFACSAEFRPNTHLLMYVGLQLGSLISSALKLEQPRPRPAQILPTLSPLIPTPRHPSFPSGHALSSKLTALLGSKAVPNLAFILHALADDIGKNREWALVHYPSDTRASRIVADIVMTTLAENEPLKSLIANAKAEYSP